MEYIQDYTLQGQHMMDFKICTVDTRAVELHTRYINTDLY